MRRAGVWLLILVGLLAVLVAPSAGRPRPVTTAAAVPPVLRIMPLGASSTVGARSPQTGGYRGPLELMLRADGIAFDMVGSQRQGPPWIPDPDHEGHGGFTAAELQPSVPRWIRKYRPDVVLLHVGTNDLIDGASGAETTRRLATMLDSIYAVADPDPYVVVAGVWAPLKGAKGAAKAEYARGAAATVAGLRAVGRPVVYVDTANLLANGDVADGLHANTAGYQLIARMWHREILRYLDSNAAAVSRSRDSRSAAADRAAPSPTPSPTGSTTSR